MNCRLLARVVVLSIVLCSCLHVNGETVSGPVDGIYEIKPARLRFSVFSNWMPEPQLSDNRQKDYAAAGGEMVFQAKQGDGDGYVNIILGSNGGLSKLLLEHATKGRKEEAIRQYREQVLTLAKSTGLRNVEVDLFERMPVPYIYMGATLPGEKPTYCAQASIPFDDGGRTRQVSINVYSSISLDLAKMHLFMWCTCFKK